MFNLLDLPVSAAYDLVTWLASMTGVALAIVIFTLGVRLLLLPLSKAAAVGGKARAELMPRVQQLRDRYRHDPQRLQREITGLQRESGVSMFTGCLPALAQIPFFIVMYRLFYATTIAGHPNMLLAGTLFGAPLGGHFAALASGPHVLVFVGLFALLAIVAWFSSRWQARQGQGPALLRLLPYGTVLAAAVVPLAAGLYLLVTNTWTVVERAVLHG